jgi:hypothetical protein
VESECRRREASVRRLDGKCPQSLRSNECKVLKGRLRRLVGC